MDRAELIATLREWVGRELLHGQADGLDDKTPLLEWGVIDSLAMVSLLAFVEERWRLRVPEEEVRPEHFVNLTAIADLLGRLPAGAAAAAGAAGRGRAPEAEAARPDPMSLVRALEPYGVRSVRAALGGADLHRLEVDGPGPTWVLWPALGMPATAWATILRVLAGERRAVAPDLCGFGLSAMAGQDGAAPALSDHVRHALALVDALGDGELALAGASAGALIAAEVARQRPARVKGLCIVGFGLPADPAGWWAELLEKSGDTGRFLGAAWWQPPALAASARALLESALRAPAYRAFLDGGEVARLGTFLDGLAGVPALLVHGDADRIVPEAAVSASAARLGGAPVERIARCGHLPPLERPQELLLLMKRFFEARGHGSA